MSGLRQHVSCWLSREALNLTVTLFRTSTLPLI